MGRPIPRQESGWRTASVIVIGMLVVIILSSASFGAVNPRFDLELRLAASPEEDTAVIQAYEGQGDNVADAGKGLARWVPIEEEMLGELTAVSDIVVREGKIFVLLGDTDILGSFQSTDLVPHLQTGEPLWWVRFNGQTKERLEDLTRQHIGRRVALIVNGSVRAAPRIVQPIRDHVVVPATKAEVPEYWTKMPKNVTRGMALRMCILRWSLIAAAVAGVVAVALFIRRILKRKN